MPPLSRTCLRAALAWLLIGLGMGVVQAAWPADVPAGWRPAVFHFITVGWLSQMIFGVANWMFPRTSREHPRGYERLGWVAFVALNTGLALRAVSEPFQSHAVGGPALALSGALQFLAALAWVIHIWPRVGER